MKYFRSSSSDNSSGQIKGQLSRHIPALDGVRGIAILLVMALHFGGSEIDPTLSNSSSSAVRLYLKIADFGGAGVDLFFVLSGFLITRILLQERGRKHFLRNFYMRRALRIFPLYYGTLIVSFGVVPFFYRNPSPALQNIYDNQIWLWTYTENIALSAWNQNWNADWLRLNHFWSLAIEEQFYLFWPFLILTLSEKHLVRICVGFVVAAVAFKLWFLGHDMMIGAYVFTLCRMDAISLGSLLALLSFPRNSVEHLVQKACVGVLISAIAIALLAATGTTDWWTIALIHTTLSIFFVSLLIFILDASATGIVGRIITHRFLCVFGKYSYGLYVLHYMLRPALIDWFPVSSLADALQSRLLGLLAFAAIATSISLAAAVASYHVYEQRFLAFKRFFGTHG